MNNLFKRRLLWLCSACLFFIVCNTLAWAESGQRVNVPPSLAGQVSAEEWQDVLRQVRSHSRYLPVAAAAENSRVVRAAGDTILNQTDYLKASNTDAGDHFSVSVAVSGNTMVVGADFEDSDGVGEDGNPSSNALLDSGAAYVFVRDAGGWRQQAYLKASNPGAGDRFGRAVGISGDTIVVSAVLEDGGSAGVNPVNNDSAIDAGAAYIFVREGEIWIQQAYLKASNPGTTDRFGESVAISGDTVAVGAQLEDSSTSGVNPGQNGAATDSGAAYVFVRNSGVWSQQAFIKASNPDVSDFFGFSLDIDGDTLVVGAYREDSASTVVNGGQGNSGLDGQGAAYVFVRSGTNWSQQAYLKAPNADAGDSFGVSVAVSGDNIVVGAYFEDSAESGIGRPLFNNSATDSGAAYLYTRSNTGTWRYAQYIKASNSGAGDQFGREVDISGNLFVVGSILEDGSNSFGTGVPDNDVLNAGAAYLFLIDGQDVSQLSYLKASNAGADDHMGVDVAISGASAVVGVYAEDSSSTGVNGLLDNNDALDAGAAYVFAQTASFHPVGGHVVGLAENNRVILLNNASEELAVDRNGSFRFGPLYESGSVYAVTVSEHPESPRQDCMISNGSGVISSHAIDDIIIDCSLRTLSIDTHLNTVDGADLLVPIQLAPEGESLSGVAFSLDYDASCLNPDGDNDGVLDQINFFTPAEFTATVLFDPSDSDGEIDISFADLSPPLSSLSTGNVVEILFHVDCPESQNLNPLYSSLDFADDPEPSFSNLLGQVVSGSLAPGEVRVWAGIPGDCNVSGEVEVGDLVSIGLEIFDGDGSDYIDAPESDFFGSPLGCDANGDQSITIADAVCANLILFGASCEPVRNSAGYADVEINITPYLQDEIIWLPLSLNSNGHGVAGAALSLNLDLNHFDTALIDLDRDTEPDRLRYPQGRPARASVQWRVDGNNGYLDIVIAEEMNLTLDDGVIMEIGIPAAALPTTGLSLTTGQSPSFSDLGGFDLHGFVSLGTGLFDDSFESAR